MNSVFEYAMYNIEKIVKLDNIGIGIILEQYDNDVTILINEKKYYRDINDSDVIKSNLVEYWQFKKECLTILTEKSKMKRKEASNWNKETNGVAVKRKGKVAVINGNIYALCENNISKHHRELLEDAKKAKQLKDNIKNEINHRKNYIQESLELNIEQDKEEIKILGIKVKKGS